MRAGRGDYEADARKIITQLYDTGSVQQSPLHDVLDELFRTPQTIEAIGALMARQPMMCDNKMLAVLDGFTIEEISVKCVVRAVSDTTAIIRVIIRAVQDQG